MADTDIQGWNCYESGGRRCANDGDRFLRAIDGRVEFEPHAHYDVHYIPVPVLTWLLANQPAASETGPLVCDNSCASGRPCPAPQGVPQCKRCKGRGVCIGEPECDRCEGSGEEPATKEVVK